MEKDGQRQIEDRKALQDAIKRALAVNDEEEVKRLTEHLNWLEKELSQNN